MTGDDMLITALKQALEKDPRNGPLWLHYADLLHQAGRAEDAIAALRTLLEIGGDTDAAAKKLVPLLRQAGQLAEALIRAEKILAREDHAPTRLELARILFARGDEASAREELARARAKDPSLTDADLGSREPALEAKEPVPETSAASGKLNAAAAGSDRVSDEDLARQFEWGDLRVAFSDVAGLDEVKKQIHLRIIAPFKNREVYRAFNRQGGGGILLYGPPGCGKTYVAKATAGECGARFLPVGIHEIVDKYWGESEKLMHQLFEEARRRAPTVLFFDEFDALGASRGKTDSQFWTTLVDQLLQEMDGFGRRNEDVLVFAATNAPWNVDPAFRRPGRFDRLLFVPPPDDKAREEILRRHVEKLPGGAQVSVASLVTATPLYTGADLKSLCERASDQALGRSLETGRVEPISPGDFQVELKRMTSSASEWFATARNYARYSNEGGQYDELTDYLKRVKKW